MPTYVSPFTGDVVQPTDVSYYELTFSSNAELTWPGLTVPGGTTIPASRIMECVAQSAGLEISLPPGNQGAVGTDILFRNLGANSFTVVDVNGGQGLVLAAGEAKYVYLTDNSTVAGVWGNVAFGVGTSFADAATLAGSGLTDIVGKLATNTQVIRTSNNITFAEADRGRAYVWIGGTGSAALPTLASIYSGWYVILRNNGTGTITVNPPAGKTINSFSSQDFLPTDSAIIVCDYSTGNFFTVGLPRQVDVAYTAATYDVDSIPGSTFDLTAFAPSIQTYLALSGTRTTTLTVELPAITQIYVISNDTNQAGYNIEIMVTGSIITPIILPTGTTALILTDGSDAFLLSQGATTTFFAADGTITAPTFTFINDTGTGLYLSSTYNMRVASNGFDMINIDASNPGALSVSTPATFNAALISGGTF